MSYTPQRPTTVVKLSLCFSVLTVYGEQEAPPPPLSKKKPETKIILPTVKLRTVVHTNVPQLVNGWWMHSHPRYLTSLLHIYSFYCNFEKWIKDNWNSENEVLERLNLISKLVRLSTIYDITDNNCVRMLITDRADAILNKNFEPIPSKRRHNKLTQAKMLNKIKYCVSDKWSSNTRMI